MTTMIVVVPLWAAHYLGDPAGRVPDTHLDNDCAAPWPKDAGTVRWFRFGPGPSAATGLSGPHLGERPNVPALPEVLKAQGREVLYCGDIRS